MFYFPGTRARAMKFSRKLIRDNIKKQRAAQAELDAEAVSDTGTLISEYDDEKVIIKTKPSQPKFVNTVLKVIHYSSTIDTKLEIKSIQFFCNCFVTIELEL